MAHEAQTAVGEFRPDTETRAALSVLLHAPSMITACLGSARSYLKGFRAKHIEIDSISWWPYGAPGKRPDTRGEITLTFKLERELRGRSLTLWISQAGQVFPKAGYASVLDLAG